MRGVIGHEGHEEDTRRTRAGRAGASGCAFDELCSGAQLPTGSLGARSTGSSQRAHTPIGTLASLLFATCTVLANLAPVEAFGRTAWRQSNAPPDTLSLPRLQALAAQNAVDVLIAQRDLGIARLDVERLRADLRPQVRLDATVPSFFRSFRETVQPDGTVRFQPVRINNSSVAVSASQAVAKTGGAFRLSTGLQRFDDFEQNFNIYNGSVVRFGYSQPLWGYNEFKWRRQTVPLRARLSEAQLTAARAQAMLEATQAFFVLAQAAQSVAIADSNVVASERLLNVANERYALGKISRGDLVQLELDLADAEQNRLRATQTRLAASTAIYQLLGLTYGGQVLEPVAPGLPEGLTEGGGAAVDISAEDAVTLARQRRPELLAAEARTLDAQSQLEFDRRNNGFQASLSASIGLIRSANDLEVVYNDPQIEQVVELQLSVPIVDWGRRKAIVRQSELDLALARTIGERAQTNLATDVRLAVAQLNQARQELTLIARVRDLAEERYQIARESYLLGAVPLTELTLARQARDERLRQYLFTLETAWTAAARLKAFTLEE